MVIGIQVLQFIQRVSFLVVLLDAVLHVPATRGDARRPISAADEMPAECACLMHRNRVGRLFEQARRELKDRPQSQLKSSTIKKYPATEGFPEFFFGTLGLDSFVINGTLVSDVIIFKMNSENIFYNLADAETPRRLAQEHTWKDKTRIYTSTSPEAFQRKRSSEMHYMQAVAGPYRFAFIRDPLQHLVSGIVESHFRNLHLDNPAYPNTSSEEFQRHAVGHYATVQTAGQIITALTTASPKHLLPYLSFPKHMTRLTYALLLWQPDFIGQLEHFNEDWDSIMRRMGLHIMYEVKDIYHPTVDDPLNMKHSIEELITSDPQYLRALCRLVSVDYYCLNYSLPTGCEDLFDGSQWREYSKGCNTIH